MNRSDPAYAGQHIYSPWFLSIYDPLVLGFFASLVWRCPTRRLVDNYSRHLGPQHLDVGPGTGYFLDHARLPAGFELVLIDPNPHVLQHAARRLRRMQPGVVQADACSQLPVNQTFDSVGLNYVLHCLPGPMSARSGVIRGLAALLRPSGVLFGATVLGSPELHTWLSLLALRDNNRRGIFDNDGDTASALQDILNQSFSTVAIDIIGSVAVFSAREPHRRDA